MLLLQMARRISCSRPRAVPLDQQNDCARQSLRTLIFNSTRLVRPADHVQHGLPLLLFDDFERALERRQNLLRIVDHFTVAAVRGDDHLVARRRRQIAQGKIVRTHRPAVRHDLLRCRFGGVPDRVVADDR